MWSSVDEACSTVVRVAQKIAPNPGSTPVMRESYQRFRKSYPALRAAFA
jgi:sugar (pentulose or hexulose) kinase